MHRSGSHRSCFASAKDRSFRRVHLQQLPRWGRRYQSGHMPCVPRSPWRRNLPLLSRRRRSPLLFQSLRLRLSTGPFVSPPTKKHPPPPHAPSPASARAIAAPIPVPPPVIRACRLSSTPIRLFPSLLRYVI